MLNKGRNNHRLPKVNFHCGAKLNTHPPRTRHLTVVHVADQLTWTSRPSPSSLAQRHSNRRSSSCMKICSRSVPAACPFPSACPFCHNSQADVCLACDCRFEDTHHLPLPPNDRTPPTDLPRRMLKMQKTTDCPRASGGSFSSSSRTARRSGASWTSSPRRTS